MSATTAVQRVDKPSDLNSNNGTTPTKKGQNDTDDKSKDKKAFLVLVQAPWCPYCQMLRPEWDDLTHTLSRDVPQLQIVEFDRSVIPAARKVNDPLIAAMDETEEVGTVPRIALVLPLPLPSTSSSTSTQKEETEEKGKTVFLSFNYDDYDGPEGSGEHRSQENILHFIRDTIREVKGKTM